MSTLYYMKRFTSCDHYTVIQMMICNGLHKAYMHAMRWCYLWECNRIVTPVDAGEHWLLLDNSMSYAGGGNLRMYLMLMYELLFTIYWEFENDMKWIFNYYLLRVWEWHKMNM